MCVCVCVCVYVCMCIYIYIFPFYDHLKCYCQLSYVVHYDCFSFSPQLTVFPGINNCLTAFLLGFLCIYHQMNQNSLPVMKLSS